MQIKELVLYGYNGKKRSISFELGSVNIITGRSQSGKSAIGDIIDYCLGGTSCNIADGIIRESVAWYGLLLVFPGEQIFVARQNPGENQQSTSAYYIEIGETVKAPEEVSFVQNSNMQDVEKILSSRIGISENLHIPPLGQTRNPLAANIRHALFYCFQSQDEMAARNFLFHKQSDDFITLAIRDTLPYFLGVVSDDALSLSRERDDLRRQHAVVRRRINETKALMGDGLNVAISLASEAKQIGLLDSEFEAVHADYNSIYIALKNVCEWQPEDYSFEGEERLSYLQIRLDELAQELETLDEDIASAKSFSQQSSSYREEAEHQKVRLESIGLFDQLDFEPEKCPLCSGDLAVALPEAEALKSSIRELDAAISNVSKEKPRLQSFIDEKLDRRQLLREEVKAIKADIEGVFRQSEQAKQIRDINSRKAVVVGRISLWLESVQESYAIESLEDKARKQEERLAEIDELLDGEASEERKRSALSRIQVDMSLWAKELELEHSENPYRLDINNATVIVDKPNRPVPLRQIGSGSNWVGVHLITFFALQKFFISADRPVPRFLFLDQPSQVYFPSENDEKRTDWDKVKQMYGFIFDRVTAESGNLQVIIVDHADLKDESFQGHVLEDWHDSGSLIPSDWLDDSDSTE